MEDDIYADFYLNQRTTKPTKKTCATSEDSDQPAHPGSLIRVFIDRMCLLLPPGYPKRDTREPLPYLVVVLADLCLCWSHRSYSRFCHALAQLFDVQGTKRALMQFAVNAGPDQPAQMRRLIRDLVDRLQNQWILYSMSTNRECPD